MANALFRAFGGQCPLDINVGSPWQFIRPYSHDILYVLSMPWYLFDLPRVYPISDGRKRRRKITLGSFEIYTFISRNSLVVKVVGPAVLIYRLQKTKTVPPV